MNDSIIRRDPAPFAFRHVLNDSIDFRHYSPQQTMIENRTALREININLTVDATAFFFICLLFSLGYDDLD